MQQKNLHHGAGRARKQLQRAFTLIELMLVIGIVAILGAIAIPTYSQFTLRTKVAELVTAAGAFKTMVAEKAQQDGGVLTRAGVGLTVSATGRVTGGSVTDSGIISIAGSQTTVGTAITVVLTPSLAADSKVVWTCSADTNVWKYVPAECRH